jgi:signal peptidase I
MTTPEGNPAPPHQAQNQEVRSLGTPVAGSSEPVSEPVAGGVPPAPPGDPQPELHSREPDESTAPPGPVNVPQDGETLLQSLLSIIVIVLFVITFIVQAFQIPSPSMERTLLVGDYLLVDKIHFGQSRAFHWLLPYSDIKRGDIVVFHYPVDPTQHFVKRVIGIPGDHILLRNKVVWVNDMAQHEKYAVHLFNHDGYRDNFPSEADTSGQVNPKWRAAMPAHLQDGELVVPPDHYFVMGDNRDNSLDSRYWGFVPRANIVGRPLIIYLSVRERSNEPDGSNGKLIPSGHLLAHIWQFARWDRMFHLVR